MRDQFGSWEAVRRAEVEELAAFPRMTLGTARNILKLTDAKLAGYEAGLEDLDFSGISMVCPEDERYPEGLSELQAPPKVLFYRGDLPMSREQCVAVVGTRTPTTDGADAAYWIANTLARAGAWIISGMALGIDAHAHRGALEGQGATLAFLGSGVDCPEPLTNFGLAEDIVQLGGGLASENPPGAPSGRNKLIARNRLIAAVASAVVVIETGEMGGTISTVQCALRLQRPVIVLQWESDDPARLGNKALIYSQAALPVSVKEAPELLRAMFSSRAWPGSAAADQLSLLWKNNSSSGDAGGDAAESEPEQPAEPQPPPKPRRVWRGKK